MRKTVLVADDNEEILEVIQIVLEDEGYSVHASLDGACFRHMQGNLPDLILLDVLLSGEDGREICQQLKRDPRTKNIPVILISAHSRASEAAQMSSADEFLRKPFDLDVLIDLVKKYTSPCLATQLSQAL